MASCEPGSSLRSLECPICTEILTDPRVLPCGHSICGPKSEDECIVKLEINGCIVCPTCRSPHQIRAEDVPQVYGFKDMLESLKKKEMCEKHQQEIMFICHSDKEKLCVMCWHSGHMGDHHKVEPLLTVIQKQVQALWEKLDLKKLNEEAQTDVNMLECQIENLETAVKILKEEKLRREEQVRNSASFLERQHAMNLAINSKHFNPKSKEVQELQKFEEDLERNELKRHFCLKGSLKLVEKTCSSLTGILDKDYLQLPQKQGNGTKKETEQEQVKDGRDVPGADKQDSSESSRNTDQESTSDSVAPFGWTKACILQRIDTKCWWELLYCSQTDHVFFATMTNAVKKYKFDSFTSRLVPEDSFQFKNVLSSIALAPNFSLYISFRSHSKPNVWQFSTRTRMSEKLNTPTNSVTEDHRLKWNLASYPEKQILLLLASYSGACSNAVYVFHNNNFIRQCQIPVDTRFAHFYPFGLKTGLLSDCHPANETVLNRFEWDSLLQPTDEQQVRHFFEVTDPNCQLVHISDVTETRRRILVLGYKESEHDKNVLVGHVLEARKVKQARAEFVSRFELSQNTDFIPFHLISFENGIVLGKERLSDNVILMKLL